MDFIITYLFFFTIYIGFYVQFDLFSHLNTDDTVRRIKEILSQYSISQRLFGEAVLGLSQVSALSSLSSVTSLRVSPRRQCWGCHR